MSFIIFNNFFSVENAFIFITSIILFVIFYCLNEQNVKQQLISLRNEQLLFTNEWRCLAEPCKASAADKPRCGAQPADTFTSNSDKRHTLWLKGPYLLPLPKHAPPIRIMSGGIGSLLSMTDQRALSLISYSCTGASSSGSRALPHLRQNDGRRGSSASPCSASDARYNMPAEHISLNCNSNDTVPHILYFP